MSNKRSNSGENKTSLELQNVEEIQPLKPITEEHAKDTPTEEDPKISYFALFKFATSLDKVLLILGSLCAVTVGIAMPVMLMWLGHITGYIIDFVVGMNHTSTDDEVKILKDDLYEHLYDYVMKVCSTGAIAILLAYISGVLFTYTSTKQVTKIRQLLLSQMLNADIGWHDSNKTTDFTTTFTENLSIIGDSLGTKTSWFLNNGGTVVTCFIISLYHGWQLSLVCFCLLPVTTCIVGIISWLSAKMSSRELQSHSSAGSLAEEVLSSIRTVVAFDGQKKEIERYEKFLAEGKISNIRKALFNGLSMGVSQAIMYITCGVAYWYGAQLVTQNVMEPLDERVYTPATVNIIYMTSFSIHFKIQQILPLIDVFGSAKGAAVKVFSILNMKPVINVSKVGGKIFPSINGNINFRNVFFNYPSREDVKILRGIDLEIKSGQTVALVGSSGCGKSTIVQLVQRFYDPLEGTILLDGTDLKELNLVWLRKQIGVVSQEPVLFDTSILENIRYGNLLATDADIENAARKANAHEFISQLPQGYHTQIGEGGAQLSGGQKQRVAIARALVKRPRILLLDEATSALDTTSEAEVQAALDQIEHECTTIIVAHRLSTVRNADKIVVMSDGEIKEQGTHSKLMELRGAYYNLVESQEINVKESCTENTTSKKTLRQISNASNKVDLHEDEKENSEKQNEEAPSSIFEVLNYNKSQLHLILLGCIMAIIGGCTKPVQSILFGDMVGASKRAGEPYGVGMKTSKFAKLSLDSNDHSNPMQKINARCLLYATTTPLNDSACKMITVGLNQCANFTTVIKIHSDAAPNTGVVLDTSGFNALMKLLAEIIKECEIESVEERRSFNLEHYIIKTWHGTNMEIKPKFPVKYGYNICLGIATFKRLQALQDYIQDVISGLEKDETRINTATWLRTAAEEAAMTAIDIGEVGSLNAEILVRICNKLGPRYMDLAEIAAKFSQMLLPMVCKAVTRILETNRPFEYSPIM